MPRNQRRRAKAGQPLVGKGKKKARKRETIDTGRDTRYVRRNDEGEFEHVVEKGRSLAQDRRKKAKKVVASGQGDKGDQKPRKKTSK